MQQRSVSTRLRTAYIGLASVDACLAGSTHPAARPARRVTKPLLMPALAASLVTSERAQGSGLKWSTLAAQAGGWGGDVALLGEGDRAFFAGTASFAVGHAAYLLGFQRHRTRTSSITSEAVPRALAATWLVSAPVLAWGAARTDPRLGVAVAGYSAIITTMAATASRLDPEIPAGARRLAAVGSGLFMVSDLILGARMFLLKDPPTWLEVAVMATYTAAQGLLNEAAIRAGD